ncbi:hypothetical protein J421_2677 [Gemmatirosa kalamazoonensis]|uniref:Uncharacterized protein n=1 Tax=Gemmatirosa kalamazoonensis TaxID=861299 RepID=W0RGL3_9BACT|nr:hypothetical protein [Gemmatirosa kalamazoonensis]AHG90214.1 hypothetical protein J421_2677 [Gemmatirosa kalamazoonensis]
MPVRCAGQRVTDVVVLTQPPYTNSLIGRVAFVERTVRKLHATTRPELVDRFLLLHPGDRCDELRRAESERILRAQPYLVDARVTSFDDGHGGVRLEVETRDEFSAIVDAAARAEMPIVTHLRVGEANLAGSGLYASADWKDGGTGYRDGFGGRLTNYQFLGRPFQLTVQGAREGVGDNWWGDLTHPFYTDLQRIAWRASVGGRNDFIELVRPRDDDNALFYRRAYASLGAVLRIGAPGRLSLFGGSLSTERAETEDRVAVLSDSGEVPDLGEPLGFSPAEHYKRQHAVRLNSLWGIRNVRFLGATGFDALTGRQDVRRGFQLSTVVGRGLAALGSRDDDVFTSVDMYAGLGTARAFAAGEVRAEGRHDYDTGRWDGIVVSGRAAWYLVPDAWWRTQASVEVGAARAPRVPFQLTLGALDGGVRGFRAASAAGAARAVARLEQRRVLGTPLGLGDMGVAAFADVGRTLAGSAPYGVDSGTQASVGVGVLGAFPPRSRRLWRIDLAFPVTHSPGAKFDVIVSNRDLTRLFWREPRDIQRAREQAVPASVFTWP